MAGDQGINLRRKTFDVLLYLVDHPGQLVTKEALLDAVWPGVMVSDSMPATCVKELRKALGDEAKDPAVYRDRASAAAIVLSRRSPATAAREATRKPPQPRERPKTNNGRPRRWNWLDCKTRMRRYSKANGSYSSSPARLASARPPSFETFLDSIAQEGTARVGRGQCVEQYGSGEPYMPVLEALSRLSQEHGGEQVIEVLNKFAPTWLAQMPELLTREERARLQSEMQGVTQQRMLREMTQALEALAAEMPLVLLLEDLHWSDFSTLELISAIARRSEPARMLIVGTYRPVEILANDHPLRTMKQELELHRLLRGVAAKAAE